MEWDRINYKNKDELYKTMFKQNQKGIVALQDTWKEFERIWYMSPDELSLKLDLNSAPYVELVGKAIGKISDEYNLNSNQNYSIQALMCKPCCIETNKMSKYFLYYWANGHNTDLKLVSKMTESLYDLIISNNN
ncbi:hypothetical protein D3C78_1486410 [compost metagenome]